MPEKITIWIQGIRELAGAYWSRRRYQEVNVRRIDAGVWVQHDHLILLPGKRN